MFSKRELLSAIEECEKNPSDYHDCAKLATFYALYDHLYPGQTTKTVDEAVVGSYGDSEFYKAIEGMNAEKAWSIMSELMDTMMVMQPKVYQSVLKKLAQ